MLRIAGVIYQVGQVSVHLLPGGRVIGFLDRLQREVSHCAVVHAINQRMYEYSLSVQPLSKIFSIRDSGYLSWLLGLALRLVSRIRG
jgi:hypothetical protein